MSNDSYTVPMLSLTNSRSRKSIPTRDAYQPRTYLSQTINVPMTPISYLQKKQQPSQNYLPQHKYISNYTNLPPRPKTNQMYPPNISRGSVKQISRNVYLSSEEQSTQNARNFQQVRNQTSFTSSNTAVQRARDALRHSGSRGSLLGNPQSRVEIQNEVKRQTNNMQFKKIDINKALFDRKLSKIMQEIDFYEQQLNGLYTESLIDRIEELQDIKKQNKQAQSKILSDLNSLIA